MGKTVDIDRTVIIILITLFFATLILLPKEAIYYALGVIAAIFSYIVLVEKNKQIYGFSGLKLLSPPSLIIATYTIFIALPSVYICAVNNKPSVTNYYFAILLFYILFPLGLKIGDLLRPINKTRIRDLNIKNFAKSDHDKYAFEFLIVLFVICFLIFILYLYRVDSLPLLELIKNPGQHAELMVLREKSLKLLQMTFIEGYIFNWLRLLFIPIGIIGSMVLNQIYGKKKYFILFMVFFVFGLINNTLTLEKSPTAGIFLSIVTFVYLRKFQLSTKLIFSSFILIFIVPITLIYFRYLDHPNLAKLIYISLSYRIFVVPSEVLYYYFKYIPSVHDFLYGQSSHLFSWLYTEGTFNLDNYIAKVWWGDPKTSGFANTMFIGYFWADFGWLGIIFSCVMFGIIIHLLYWKILQVSQYSKNIFYSVFVTVLLPSFTFGFFGSNIPVLFFTRGIILVVFFLIWIQYHNENKKHKDIKLSNSNTMQKNEANIDI